MRVGLRCLPFRKAPKIIEVLANESVFYYEGVQGNVSGSAIETDERLYPFESPDSLVTFYPDTVSETGFTYEGEQDDVIAIIPTDEREFRYEAADSRITVKGGYLDRVWAYEDSGYTAYKNDVDAPTDPDDPETPPDTEDPDVPVTPPLRVTIPFEIDVSGVTCTPGYGAAVLGHAVSGSMLYAAPVATGAELEALPSLLLDTTALVSGGVSNKWLTSVSIQLMHPLGFYMPCRVLHIGARVKVPILTSVHSGNFLGVTTPWLGTCRSVLFYDRFSESDPWDDLFYTDRLRLDGLLVAKLLRLEMTTPSDWGVVSLGQSRYRDGDYRRLAYSAGITPRFLPGSYFRLRVFDTWLTFDLQTVTQAQIQDAINTVTGVAANGGLTVSDFDVMSPNGRLDVMTRVVDTTTTPDTSFMVPMGGGASRKAFGLNPMAWYYHTSSMYQNTMDYSTGDALFIPASVTRVGYPSTSFPMESQTIGGDLTFKIQLTQGT